MRVNVNFRHAHCIEVYLDGKKLTTCIEADDKEGYVWVLAETGDKPYWAALAHPGDFIWDDCIVKRLAGRVEIKFLENEAFTEDEMKEEAKQYCEPIRVHQLVQ